MMLLAVMWHFINHLKTAVISDIDFKTENVKLYQKILNEFLSGLKSSAEKTDLESLINTCKAWNTKLKDENDKLEKSIQKYQKIYIRTGMLVAFAVVVLIIVLLAYPTLPVLLTLVCSALAFNPIVILELRNTKRISSYIELSNSSTSSDKILSEGKVLEGDIVSLLEKLLPEKSEDGEITSELTPGSRLTENKTHQVDFSELRTKVTNGTLSFTNIHILFNRERNNLIDSNPENHSQQRPII